MPDYTSNFAALLTGHLDLPVNKGGVGVKPVSAASIPPRIKYDNDLDVRDIISSFVSRKDKDLSNEKARKDYNYLSSTIGEQMARKLMNHIFIFNQRVDQKNQSFEKRLSSLYDIGSNDKDIDHLLKYTSTLGQGPIEGARSSVNVNVMSAEGSPNATTKVINSVASAMQGK